MQRWTVICTNACFLAILLIGIPALTSLDLGRWRLNSKADAHQLLIWALGTGTLANVLLARFMKRKKTRETALQFAILHALLLIIAWLNAQDLISFAWLKTLLPH